MAKKADLRDLRKLGFHLRLRVWKLKLPSNSEGMAMSTLQFLLISRTPSCLMFDVWSFVVTCKKTTKAVYFSAAHIFSKKGMKGMKPSSSSGSQSSFIKPLASSLVSFSPRLVRRRKSSFPIMVLSLFLS